MTERDSSVAPAEVEAALGKVVSLAGYRGLLRKTSGAKRVPTTAAASPSQSTRYELAFLERDIGFEPTTFSLGKRKRPFLAVTGSDK